MTYTTFDTPVGPLRATFAAGGALRQLCFVTDAASGYAWQAEAPAATLASQLRAYFRGERRAFDVPLALDGHAFEKRVWKALQNVPFGTTVTYGALAEQLGAPGAAQAVGRACAANPVLVVVPCHRVTGAKGGLTGFAGGTERKAALLRHEGALLI